jgi:hypothetical protein
MKITEATPLVKLSQRFCEGVNAIRRVGDWWWCKRLKTPAAPASDRQIGETKFSRINSLLSGRDKRQEKWFDE